MAVPVSRDRLGTVTAYSYAVAGGYTGTEAEFEELLANVAIDLSEIENFSVIVTPLSEGSTPTASYDSGVLTLGIPKGDTGDSGVYIGETAPTNPNVDVWINPNGEGIEMVQDVTVGGNSIVTDGIAEIPFANSSTYGVIKPANPLYTDGGYLMLTTANSTRVKEGTTDLYPVSPKRQHASTFYGLAKASGDTTQSQSNNAVGTYTDEAKESIQNMLGVLSEDDVVSELNKKVSNEQIDNAGIINKTYSVKFDGEFSVTTSKIAKYPNPYALASIVGRFNKDYLHKITINEVEYVLPVRLWYDEIGEQSTHGHNAQAYEYVGNLSLYIEDVSQVPDGTDNVPFLIITNRNGLSSIEVITETSGTYTLLIEEIIPIQNMIPSSLIYGDSCRPILRQKVGDLDGISIGINKLSSNKKGTFAIGFGNSVEERYGIAIGEINKVTGVMGLAIGRDNTVSGDIAMAVGNETVSSGGSSYSEGEGTTASGRASHSEGQSSTASGNYSHAEGQNSLASLDAAHSEGVNTIASGAYSHAEGNNSTASGISSHAEGAYSTASGNYSHAEGHGSTVSGNYSHAEGRNNIVSKTYSHAEGYGTIASSLITHVEGYGTIANGSFSHVDGQFNVADSYSNLSEWVANTSYEVGDKVKITTITNEITTVDGYVCKIANSDSSFILDNWINLNGQMNYAVITGNGSADNNRSNAYALDWSGNGHYMGDVYVGANADSTGGTKVATVDDIPVNDVQVNGTSIVSNGVANIPIGQNNLGLVTQAGMGVIVDSLGRLKLSNATANMVKVGTTPYSAITPENQESATFYGLAKAAGDTTQSASSNAVGTYTSEAKIAIKQMLGVTDSYDCFIEEVTGTDPVIVGEPSYRYNCGTVDTLTITPPSSGTIDVIFSSGSTPTVLTLPQTVRMPDWWVDVEANTTYEICITDGVYCGVTSWAD